MNRFHALFAALGLITLATFTLAQDNPPTAANRPPAAAPSRIAVVNFVRIFNDADQIKDLNEMIRQRTDELTKEAAQRRAVIEDKQQELTAFKPGTKDYDARRNELVRLNIDANVWMKVSEQELEQLKFDWTRVIYEKATEGCSNIAQKRGFDLVLQKTEFKPDEIEQSVQTLRRVIQDRTVAFAVPHADITEEVIKQLNADYQAGGGRKQLGDVGGTSAPADSPAP